ncbi:MAG: hypothetical protein OSA99_18740 [Acidimicrobiales bacterium]|nr:hypothetical protein [Acidimicrobiales bacterium]
MEVSEIEEAPWADAPVIERDAAADPDSGPEQPRSYPPLFRNDGPHTHRSDGGELPDQVTAMQRSIEHTVGLQYGIDLDGSSRLQAWSDPIGPGREAHAIVVRFELDETLRPKRMDEFSPNPTAAELFVRVDPEEPFEVFDGPTPRFYNGYVAIRDAENLHIVGGRRTKWADSPVTAVRSALQEVRSTPLGSALAASDARPTSELPYEIRHPERRRPRGCAPWALGGLAAFLGLVLMGFVVFGGSGGDGSEGEDRRDGSEGGDAIGTGGSSSDPPGVLTGFGLDPASWTVEWSVDPDGGISFSIVDAEGQIVPATSIRRAVAVTAIINRLVLEAMFANTVYGCGATTADYRVTCPAGAGPAPDGEYLVVTVEHEGPVGEGADRFTYGLAFDDDGDRSDNFQAMPPFDADLFADTEHWYRLAIEPDGTRRLWADGMVDGVPGVPRYSAAAVVELGNTLVWFIPRDEVPGPEPMFRATAFHDDGPQGDTPVPETSGGDVTGLGVDEPLIAIDPGPVMFDRLDALPPDVDTPLPRVEPVDDPMAHVAEVLIRDLEHRLNEALTADDPDAVVATVLPQLLAAPGGDDCRDAMESTLVQADSVELTELPTTPDLSSGVMLYRPVGTVQYPTGEVAWGPIMVPGSDGRLYFVLPSCA